METVETIIIGGGLAGLSAAIYLGRAKRDALLIDDGKSMARWEPDVQNYLGFPNGVDGTELLRRGREQARRYHIRFAKERIESATTEGAWFKLKGRKHSYRCERLLLATGIFHLPPDIPGVTPCLGHSMFFCKDCDGYRVQGKAVAVYGWTNEAVNYALGLLLYSPRVFIATDGRQPKWDQQHTRWLREYCVPVYARAICNVRHRCRQIVAPEFSKRTDSDLKIAKQSEGEAEVLVDALFTTRGDVYHTELAESLGAKVDREGQIRVDANMQTTVRGLYAAGCVTPANCQMIIAAGQGAAAAQAINRDLLRRGLATHSLRRFRFRQLRTRKTRPTIKKLNSRIDPARLSKALQRS